MQTIDGTTRIDKWLWAVRVYKTRSLACEACKKGEVTIGEQAVKPSRSIHIADLIKAKVGVVTRTLKVLGVIEKRVSATEAKKFAEDLTPAEEYEKARSEKALPPMVAWPKGQGRPTKRDRRLLNDFF
jgi:ribosome-associated heat shock protein Hsp15